MIIKDKFELIKLSTGEISNMPSLSRGTLSAYAFNKDDVNYIHNLYNVYNRTKQHPAGSVISDHIKECMVVKLDNYPLPGFITAKGLPVVNLGVLSERLITDYQPPDIFTAYLYTLSLKSYLTKKPFKPGTEDHVSNMIFAIFMNWYGKKAGLVGSYTELIPKLRFIIWLYTSVAFMGKKDEKTLRIKLSNMLQLDIDDMNLEYNFKSIIDMLKCINDNNIIPMSENKFSTTTITRTGNMNFLPVFEDISRFFASVVAVSVPGNKQFQNIFVSNKPLYLRLLDTGLTALHGGLN